jgi:hypothetical protein
MAGPVNVFICYAEADHGASLGKGEQKKWLPRNRAAPSAGEARSPTTAPAPKPAPRKAKR